jgi:hypothetical protein
MDSSPGRTTKKTPIKANNRVKIKESFIFTPRKNIPNITTNTGAVFAIKVALATEV